MALLPSIRIDIASGFNDKGFKKASRSATLLTRQFKQLGGTVAAALSVRAIANYSRAAVKAFAEEDAAVTKLTKTFKNLGLSFEAATANDFISKLQRQVAVTDDELRPALETLIRTTLDFGQAQKILGVALDVSAGTGYDLQKVTNALSKAYLGQGTALGKLNIGIGQVESKTISFNDALSRLQDRFGGQAAAAVDTYAGKFKLLSIASEEARESIGQRLILALELLSKDKSIESLTDDMDKFANKIGLAAVGLGDMLGQLNRKITVGGRSLGEIIFAAAGGGFIDALAKKGAQVEYGVKQRSLGAPGAMQQQAKDAAIRKKALEDQKKSIALQKKAAEEAAKRKREELALKRAGTIFDIENIQIVAALQGKIDGEQRLRLTALLALNNGIYDAAEKTATAIMALNAPAYANLGVVIKTTDTIETVLGKLIDAQAKASLLALGITNIPKAKNPFEAWDDVFKNIIFNLDTIAAKIRTMPTATVAPGGVPATSNGNVQGGTTNVPGLSVPIPVSGGTGMAVIADSSAVSRNPAISNLGKRTGDFTGTSDAVPNVTVNVTVGGSVTTEQDLASAIIDNIYMAQRAGQGIFLNSVAI